MINWRLRRLLVDKKIPQIELIVEVAEALGVKLQSVRNVLSGKPSRPIEEYIAERLGVRRDDLFGSRKHGRIVSRKK